jgi:protein-L-isoaspartate(D-aspartate) O-methyltransferase
MAIVGNEPVMSATLLTRLGESQFRTEQNWETVAPRLQHFPEPSAFRF